jgi:hypothetical protein
VDGHTAVQAATAKIRVQVGVQGGLGATDVAGACGVPASPGREGEGI